MFKREIETEIKGLAARYSILTLLHPRQSGKTTVPDKQYANLEFPDIRIMAIEDP